MTYLGVGVAGAALNGPIAHWGTNKRQMVYMETGRSKEEWRKAIHKSPVETSLVAVPLFFEAPALRRESFRQSVNASFDELVGSFDGVARFVDTGFGGLLLLPKTHSRGIVTLGDAHAID